jgi:hypothetical protein
MGGMSGVATHAVASRPATVANLAAAVPGLTVDAVVRAITREAAARLGVDRIESANPATERFPALAANEERLRSWDWTWGRTPKFTVEIRGVRIAVEKGVIVEADGGLEQWIGMRFSHSLPGSFGDLNR